MILAEEVVTTCYGILVESVFSLSGCQLLGKVLWTSSISVYMGRWVCDCNISLGPPVLP